MVMRFSKSAFGFFPSDVDYGDKLPEDLIEISDSLYRELLDGQSAGKIISTDDAGVPYLADPPPKTKEEAIREAESEKSNLLQTVDTKTRLWQTQLALDMISDSDKKSLISWMKYAQAIQSVDTTKAPDIKWPTIPS